MNLNWYEIIPAFLSGGAFGAILKIIWDIRAARIQPVGQRVDITPVFKKYTSKSDLKATITLVHDNSTQAFHNLFLANIEIINKGNKDIDSFEFGITLNDGDKCVYLEVSSPDRHHKITPSPNVRPDSPTDKVDFNMKPFNRKDPYTIKLYLVIPDTNVEPNSIVFSTPHPVRFISMPTMAETLADIASSTAIELGPFVLSVSNNVFPFSLRKRK